MLSAIDQSSHAICYPVELAGNYAFRAMKSSCSWKVLAVYRQGFYCRNTAGELIFVGPHSIRPGSLNVLCGAPESVNWIDEGLTPQAVGQSDGESIRFDNRFAFTLSNVQRWQPEDISGEWARSVMAERIVTLSAEGDRRQRSDGLGSLISLLLRPPQGSEIVMKPLVKMAWSSGERILEWLKSEFSDGTVGISDIRNEIRTLIGLGPGLTPAGDDFLGGILITLVSLGRKDLSDKLADCMLPMARVRTGRISYAHLLCASQGQGHETLHRAISALSVKRETGLRAALRAMDAVGHTSGWDALAGVALVLKSLLAAT